MKGESSMKKIQNDTKNIVVESLDGYARIHNTLISFDPETHMISRKVKKEKGKVRLVIGGGAGHEPAPLGFVGEGLLDAVVIGEVFTAPSGSMMFNAFQKVYEGDPLLLCVLNHAGDQMNASIAVELAEMSGIEVRKISFYDDVASAPKGHESERRGMAGGIFFNKIVGAAAEAGVDIDEAARLTEKVRDNTRTFAVALTKATHPVTGMDIINMPEDEIELGMGIHGEGGSKRSPMLTSKELAEYVLNVLLEDMPVAEGENLLVLLNGSGAATSIELSILYRDIEETLKARGINISGNLVGNIATTQELGGFSLSICKADDELQKYWDMPCRSPLLTK